MGTVGRSMESSEHPNCPKFPKTNRGVSSLRSRATTLGLSSYSSNEMGSRDVVVARVGITSILVSSWRNLNGPSGALPIYRSQTLTRDRPAGWYFIHLRVGNRPRDLLTFLWQRPHVRRTGAISDHTLYCEPYFGRDSHYAPMQLGRELICS